MSAGEVGINCEAADVRSALERGALVELALGAPGWARITGLAGCSRRGHVTVCTVAGDYPVALRSIRVRITEPERKALAS